jgi:hypothetical protein
MLCHDIITKEENESEEPNVIYEEKSGTSSGTSRSRNKKGRETDNNWKSTTIMAHTHLLQ